MSDTWRRFGLYGASDNARNVGGGTALGRALEDVVGRYILQGGIKSPVTTKRGLSARLRYLTRSAAGHQAMRDAGIDTRPKKIRDWKEGTRRPNPVSLQRIDDAYWTLRAHNVLSHAQTLKDHLNNGGRGTRMEIHPVDQTTVDANRRRDIPVRTLTVRYVWDDAVDAMRAGDKRLMGEIWEDVIADLDSDWGAYTYVSHVGIGA